MNVVIMNVAVVGWLLRVWVQDIGQDHSVQNNSWLHLTFVSPPSQGSTSGTVVELAPHIPVDVSQAM